MNVADYNTSTILRMADLRSTRATTSSDHLGTVRLLSVSKPSVGRLYLIFRWGRVCPKKGRTKGGPKTKIHADRQCALASCRHCLSGGNQADIFLAKELTERLPEDSTLIGDKAYDSSTLRQTAATKGINTCIPGRSNRTMTVPFSATTYRRRHRVENFFSRIKRYRREATRYDKLAETFLGFVCLAILFTLRLT